MHILFVPLYEFFRRRKPLFWAVFLGTFAIWAILASRIQLKEDITSMLPDSKAIHAMNDVISNTQAGEQVIFLASFTDSNYHDQDSMVNAVNDFNSGFNKQFSNYIDTIILQPGSGMEEVMTGLVQQNLPLLLTEKDYQKLDSLTNEEQIARTLAANKRILLSPASVFYKKLVAADPIGMSGIVWSKLRSLQYDDNYETYEGYLFHKQSGKLTFFMKPVHKANETVENAKFFEEADGYIENWEQAHPGINILYFGGPAVAAGNATQMRYDTILTLSVTIILLLALTFYFFRRKRTPLFLLIPVLYGGAMGLGVLCLVQGSVSVIALGAGAIIMGIAIDFSIHFLSQNRKNTDVRETVKELAQPLTLGSFTTIAAFLSLRLVNTPILQDLGLFAAASLFGAALCTLIFLPHLPIGTGSEQEVPKQTIFDKVAEWRPENNKLLLLFIVLFTPVMLYFSTGVQFDSNLMNLNYLSPKLQKAQDEVREANAVALSSVFLVAQDESGEKALQKLEQLHDKVKGVQDKGWVRGVSDPTLLLSSRKEQQRRIDRWNNYWNNEKKAAVLRAVNKEAAGAGFATGAFNRFENTLTREYSLFDSATTKQLKSLFPGGFSADTVHHYAITALKVPAEYREQVFNELSAQDIVTVTDRQQGANQLVAILNNDFTDIAIYSSLIVFFALLLGYGRFELAIIAFLPMAISWIWILGMMSILGLKFNIVNIIISSLIFGLGDDYTIFTMDGLVERYKTGKLKLASVRSAVYVSALTVTIGLGVLLLAKHPALRSIAFISVTGLVCVLFISQTLQPFLFNWLIQNRANKKYLPFTLRSFFISLFAFTYFFIGSMALTILGILFTRLWPFGRNKGKYLFHYCISKYSKSMLYIMGNAKKKIYNPANEDFKKPAIIIANHSSFLDILIMIMLNPKLVLLTNKWVWRSPVFGAVVRMAEYYPVAEGAEDSIKPLQDLANRGYSIVVFPEGTRSFDDTIHRFHKGAFYLAEQLKLDIIPVVLHGMNYCMQKGDWLLKDGTMSVYIHPRVTQGDTTFGNSYSERAKYMGRWMRSELDKIKEEKETPTYFKEQLIRCYTYKGPVHEWYCRVKTRIEGYYEQFHELVPHEGKFYDLGCGYGFLPYMLHWAEPNRSFIGIDYDDEKIETAQNNFLRDESMNFEQGDLTQVELQACDGIIINDVLHYLLPEQQEILLEKCYKALNPGGQIIVRDGVSELTERIKGTKMTEMFSTRVFSFNKTQNQLHFISRSMIEGFAARHKMQTEVLDKAKMTANLIFVLKKV
ncbi:MAG: 1-acyl-sn-glycerol-3-phosphate acyltransferase [Chitinophagales bacterium]|nr:1-acyl-sn-glycerol-3-phosphate acyltransferase [Chitinophagales bacterium]